MGERKGERRGAGGKKGEFWWWIVNKQHVTVGLFNCNLRTNIGSLNRTKDLITCHYINCQLRYMFLENNVILTYDIKKKW